MEENKLKEFLNGDLNLFHEFYEETKSKVFYNILSYVQDKHLAEDILQETYIKFLNKLTWISFHKNPIGYLFKISKNLSLDYLKSREKEHFLPGEEIEIVSYDEEKFHNLDMFEKIKLLLNKDEYQVVMLHVVNEFTHQEIANLLKKPLGTITWTYINAIKKLQKGLKK